jgi:hypothetical protein
MHLGVARLCLDCHEVHEYERCPQCTSEAFAFITRWIQLENPEPRAQPERSEPAGAGEKVNAYRQILHSADSGSRARRWLRNGSLLVFAGYMARWGWQLANRQMNGSKNDTNTVSK